MSSMKIRAVGLFAALALAGGMASIGGGCAASPTEGYAFVSSHDDTIRTVAVPIFQNPTYSHGLEVQLTDAIIKEIQRSTPWRVAPEGTANATLTGTLTGSELRRLSQARGTGLGQEMSVRLTVDFEFKDVRTGKVLVSKKEFTASDTFIPANPAGERLEVGQHAAVQRLAKDIVNELRSNW